MFHVKPGKNGGNMRIFAALILGFGLVAPAIGQTNVQIMTPNNMASCGQYMAARRAGDVQNDMYSYWAVVWIWGYLSRYNLESPVRPIKILSETATMHLWLEKFCRDNPLAGMSEAATALTVELGGNPLKSFRSK